MVKSERLRQKHWAIHVLHLVWNALTDSDPDVLIAALESIRIGRISGPVDLLIPLLVHPDTEVVLRAVEALVSIQEPWSE